MTYDAYDVSVESGDPIHLYQFTRSGQTWRFTDIARNYTALSETWSSVSLKGGRIIASKDFQKSQVDLEFPITNEFAKKFLLETIIDRTALTIYRGYIGDPDQQFVVYWKGSVSGSKVNGKIITLRCEHILSAMRQSGLRSLFQRNCRYTLYRRGCNLEIEDFAVSAGVSDIDGRTLVVSEAAYEADGWYAGGAIRAQDGVLLYVESHVGDTLVLDFAYEGLEVSSGQDVKIYPGCNLLRTTCKDKFDNLDNFGGFPFIPTRNIFDGQVI